MKKSLIITAALACCLLVGCGKNETSTVSENDTNTGTVNVVENNADALSFKQEYESFNGSQNDYFAYRDLSIDENNVFTYATAEEIVQKIENNETFFVYFGDPECPWCRSIIEQAVNSANANNVSKVYYVRIWDGFHNEILRDSYELSGSEVIAHYEGTEAYHKLLSYLDSVLEDYTLTDDNGDEISMGEKRIYAPNFVYVENGKAVELVEGISEKQENYDDELTEEILQDEKNIFDNFYARSNSPVCTSGDC